jgi:hypothetical protein
MNKSIDSLNKTYSAPKCEETTVLLEYSFLGSQKAVTGTNWRKETEETF